MFYMHINMGGTRAYNMKSLRIITVRDTDSLRIHEREIYAILIYGFTITQTATPPLSNNKRTKNPNELT